VRITVDRSACELHGQCVEREPRVFRFAADGSLEHPAEADESLRDGVADAQFLCPTQAIEVAP
jgi:ferredoxin